jgi:hypothetical protein
MYDYLNNISRNIEQNHVDIKKSQEHQKKVEYIQNELESALFGALQEYVKEYNYNIYDEDIKSMAIEDVLNTNDLKLYNTEYTMQYLNKKYYTIARQVEQVEKKQNTNKDDYKKQIALEKWEIEKQLMQQKLNEKNQKEAEKYQQDQEILKKQRFDGILKLITILCCVLFAPFILVIYGASKTK